VDAVMGVDLAQQRVDGRWVLTAIVLALPLILGVYANGLRGPFQFDDRHAIVENPALRAAAVDSTWWGSRAWTIGAGHYRPLTFVSYAMNIRFGGWIPSDFTFQSYCIGRRLPPDLAALAGGGSPPSREGFCLR
jgi:hypothetical protein